MIMMACVMGSPGIAAIPGVLHLLNNYKEKTDKAGSLPVGVLGLFLQGVEKNNLKIFKMQESFKPVTL